VNLASGPSGKPVVGIKPKEVGKQAEKRNQACSEVNAGQSRPPLVLHSV
jgi:hypothetical protein